MQQNEYQRSRDGEMEMAEMADMAKMSDRGKGGGGGEEERMGVGEGSG
jgi:hypothetical protein